MNEIINAKIYEVEFIIAGPVGFPEEGTDSVYYIRDEVLDKATKSLIGKPVLLTHAGTETLGHVAEVFKKENGYYTAILSIFDPKANELLDKGYNFSCSFTISNILENVLINAVNYKYEILDAFFEHIAVVEHPRFNEIKFLKKNSIGGKFMNFFNKKNIKENNTKKNEEPSDGDKYFVEIEGAQVPINDLIALYKSKKDNDVNLLSPDETIEIDGEQVKVSDLIALFKDKENSDPEDDNQKDEDKTKDNSIKNNEILLPKKPISYTILKKIMNSTPEFVKQTKTKAYESLDEKEKRGREKY